METQTEQTPAMVQSILCNARDSKLIAHINRVVAALDEEDIPASPDALIIRNSHEFMLVQAYRQRRLAREQAKATSALASESKASAPTPSNA